jgi:CheY-like chemotaxis protein
MVGSSCNSVSGVKPLAAESGSSKDSSTLGDLSGALHDVSNTLTVVLGWLDAAKSEIPAGKAREAIDVALSHARIGHSIARRAIGARADGAVDDGNVTRSALSVAKDSLRGVEQEALRVGVSLRLDDEAVSDLLLGSAPIAQQILGNLLLNAIHFSPAGGEVVLRLHCEDDATMSFRVIDSGPGIAAHRLATLFHSPDSTRRGGAGIGLRHAHALAESHGAHLGVARTGPTGTEFELAWPISEAPSRTHRTIPPRSLDGLRVLLLEDDLAVQALVELGLSSRGAAVAAASTFEELVGMLGTGVFDVALVDLSPLGKCPAESVALVASRQPGLPLVVISGSVAPSLDAPSIAGWVRKPFEVGELVDALGRLPAAGR